MRKITLIIIHCSATPEGRNLDFETCRHDHIHHRGFKDIGYHFYITRDGGIHRGRSLERIGAHCKNHNRHSVGICYEGGLSASGIPADTRTLEQKAALLGLAPGVAGCPARSNHCRTSGFESAEGMPLL